MITILEQSASDRKVRNFRTHRWASSNNQSNTASATFWIVRTSYRKHTFIKYLQLKALVGQCSLTELRCLVDAPGVLKDNLFIDALRAWKTDVPRNTLWQRLQSIQRLLQLPLWSLNLYYTIDNNVGYELEEVRQSIRKVKKYSGYVRNASAVGSKNSKTLHIPEPESFEWNNVIEMDYFHFLTVGEFTSGLLGESRFTLMRTKSSKRKT